MNKLKELIDKGWKIRIRLTERGYNVTALDKLNGPITCAVGDSLEWAINAVYNDLYTEDCINGI